MNEGQATVRQSRTAVGAEVSQTIVVTLVLIALNVLMFAITAVQARSLVDNQLSPLFGDFVMWTRAVAGGDEWWRLATSGFLHYGPGHLALNMIALYVLGRFLEPQFGKLRFLALYVLSLFGGSVAVYLFGDIDDGVAGASGAVYGLMGAMLVAVLKFKLNASSALVVIGLNLVLSVTLPGISLLGHLGGLVIGAAVAAGMAYAPQEKRANWQAAVVVGAFVLLVVMTVVRTGQLV
ncbi:rhomboid family intramembrane serine protease [Saccharothrix sp. NRRL B-16314]|uniref:rhomboid family intramembrane serine protease n=1 Tax=Saccharothrix sp. NRRL B-16314 TaxID=1463825 RepID=UPI000AA657F3|nr:rhomboid family intramembrane serine protease [Saccharothrix sp. NRRL B-16314]